MEHPPFRADHIGSFLKPPEIVAARKAGADVSGFRELEDREILLALEKQREAGVSVYTDGELRRRNFTGDFFAAVHGFGQGDEVKRSWSDETLVHTGAPGAVNAKLRQHSRLTAHELPFLKAHAPGPIKMTLPSPTQFPAQSYRKGVTDTVYPTPSDLLADIVEIVRGEVAALAGEGVDYLQLDAPRYSYYVDPKWRAWLREQMGAEPAVLLAEALDADNTVLRAARGSAMTVGIHLCRGNNKSQWYATGGYDAIAEQLFTTLEVDRFLLEYDDERSGTFEPLRFVPKGKTVVLGLISSKLPALEDEDELLRRIDEAAKFVPLERLALSPQCGFASALEGNNLTQAEQWAKLALVGRVARRVWG